VTERDMQAIRDDLSYLRALAAEGRTAPFLGGSIPMAAGLIFGAAAVWHWAVVSRTVAVSLGSAGIGLGWLAAVAVFLTVLFVLKRGLADKPGAQAASNRQSGNAWAALGWASFAIALGFSLAAWRTGQFVIMDLFSVVILALYGSAWALSAIVSRTRWLWVVAFGSWTAALIAAWFVGTAELYLIYAAALVLLAAVPGFLLRRQEPSETV